MTDRAGKVSSLLLHPARAATGFGHSPLSGPYKDEAEMNGKKTSRRRRSSSLMYTEPPESTEHLSDQAALPNLNAEWVNAKGARESRSVPQITALFGFRC